MRQYVTKNMSLGNEIAKYIEGAMEIAYQKKIIQNINLLNLISYKIKL